MRPASISISSRWAPQDHAPTARRASTGARIRVAALAIAAVFSAAPAARAQTASATLICDGWQWVGISSTCSGGSGWNAAWLFDPPPAGAQSYCVHAWSGPSKPVSGVPGDLHNLDVLVGPMTPLSEDCPIVYPQGDPQGAGYDAASSRFLRDALRAHVGSADILGAWSNGTPDVRVVIVDTAPDALHGGIPVGADRHGDTLAHLVEDIVCSGGTCVAEVATALALPRTSTGTKSVHGGHSGTLSDLASAIHRAVVAWEQDLVPHLVLNLSVGWEQSGEAALCNTVPSSMPPQERAVHDALQIAAQKGALIIAAAGNDTGGPSPPQGLLCPARWQEIAVQTSGPGATQGASLVVAAHGVDYSDVPLANARPGGLAAFAGTAIGGVAWGPYDTLPPALTGSSVAAAVLSAVSAVVWAVQPSWDDSDILDAVHAGGVHGGSADECPISFGTACTASRVSLCGALQQAAWASCQPSAALTHSQPPLPHDVLEALLSDVASSPSVQASSSVPFDQIARFVQASHQSTPAIFPQPFWPTCPTCVLIDSYGAVQNPNPVLHVSNSAQLTNATLVVTTSGAQSATSATLLGTMTGSASYSLTTLSPGQGITSAYITGLDNAGFSVTTQLLVQP